MLVLKTVAGAGCVVDEDRLDLVLAFFLLDLRVGPVGLAGLAGVLGLHAREPIQVVVC